MERRDVLIVGGGPAGSTCAWALRRAGLDVVVLDRARFPRDKVCAGWITPPVVGELDLDVDDYADGRVFQPVRTCRTSRIGGPEIETTYRDPISYGIRRCEFDHYLLARAGAPVRVGTLDSLRREGRVWIVNGAIRTPLVVGAGGHFCPVARRLGATPEDRPVVAAQEIEFTMDARQQLRSPVRPGVPELYFSADLDGYGWCFRKGSCLNVGLGHRDTRQFPARLQAFVDYLRARGRIIDATAARWRGHAYLLWQGQGRRVHDDGALLVGDAAGLAYPESGEGIRPAVESGLLAAAAIVAAGGRYTREDLAPYAEGLAARFGARRRLDPTRLVPAALRAALGTRVLASPWLTRHFVLDRWFLHRGQAGLPAPAREAAYEATLTHA